MADAAVSELPQHLAAANALSLADADGAGLHMRVQQIYPRCDTQHDAIAGEVAERRRDGLSGGG